VGPDADGVVAVMIRFSEFCKKINTVLDHTIYTGINAPKEHQRIIGKLMTGLGNLFYCDAKIPYEPFLVTMIDEGQTSPTPDLLLFDHENQKNVVIIEISTTIGANKDFEKVKEWMKDYEVKEGFVYNNTRKTWRKFKHGVGEITENPSYCEAISMDLGAMF